MSGLREGALPMKPNCQARYRRAAILLVLCLLGPGAGSLPAEESPGDAGEPWPGTLPRVEAERSACLLVRDATNGRPVEGAVVTRHPEAVLGPAGWGPEEGRWTTDALGLVAVPVPEDEAWTSHWVVRAPGYAPSEEYGERPNEVVDLLPARRVHGRIVDLLGRPVAGVRVEAKLGCAHAPAVAEATTDAMGVFAFAEAPWEGDVVVVDGPGTAHEYGVDVGPAWAVPPVHVAEPGREVTGRVVIAPERLLEPRTLHCVQTSRGPLARIASDGAFVLRGVSGRRSPVELVGYALEGEAMPAWMRAEKWTQPRFDPAAWRPGTPIVWDVERDPAEEERGAVALRLLVTGPGEAEEDGIGLHVDRVADGRRRTITAGVNEEDGEEVAVLPGAYEVRSADPLAAFGVATTRLVVGPEGATARLEARPRPTLEVEVGWEGDGPDVSPPAVEVVEVSVADPDGLGVVAEGREVGDSPIHVPEVGEVLVTWLDRAGPVAALAGPARDGRRVARLRVPRPRWIVVPDLWPCDDPEVEGTAGGPARRDQGVVRIPVPGPGRYALTCGVEAGTAMRAVDVPDAADAVVTLSRQDLEPAHGVLVVRTPPGVALDDYVTAWRRTLLGSDHPWPDARDVAVRSTAEGTWTILDAWIAPGTRVRLQPGEDETSEEDVSWMPVVVDLEGPGPWRTDLPRGGVDVVVEGDVASTARLLLDGEPFGRVVRASESPQTPLRIRGLRPGRHVLLVAAHGHESRVHRFDLTEDEVASLSVRLPRRP